MSEPSSQPTASAPKKAWYRKWWVWLIVAAVIVGGISAILNPGGGEPTGAAQPTQTTSVVPTASGSPTNAAPLDLETFLTESGVKVDSVRVSGRKAWIYVPSDTTNEQAQQIANDSMQYACDQAKQAGESDPAVNRVEVTDKVSIYSPGYNAADHPSGFATEEVCRA